MADKIQLTDLETRALGVLFDSADGNGHDFGFIDDLVDARIMGKDQVAGVVASLAKKGVIFNWGTEPTGIGRSSYTQFTWGRDGRGIYPDSLEDLCDQLGLVRFQA